MQDKWNQLNELVTRLFKCDHLPEAGMEKHNDAHPNYNSLFNYQ